MNTQPPKNCQEQETPPKKIVDAAQQPPYSTCRTAGTLEQPYVQSIGQNIRPVYCCVEDLGAKKQ